MSSKEGITDGRDETTAPSPLRLIALSPASGNTVGLKPIAIQQNQNSQGLQSLQPPATIPPQNRNKINAQRSAPIGGTGSGGSPFPNYGINKNVPMPGASRGYNAPAPVYAAAPGPGYPSSNNYYASPPAQGYYGANQGYAYATNVPGSGYYAPGAPNMMTGYNYQYGAAAPYGNQYPVNNTMMMGGAVVGGRYTGYDNNRSGSAGAVIACICCVVVIIVIIAVSANLAKSSDPEFNRHPDHRF